MARKPSTVDYSRFSYCVPKDDVDVINWIAVQHNLSMSLRALIKNEVQKNGLCDIFCKPITNPGVSPGRPKTVVMPQAEQVQQIQQTQPVQMQPVQVQTEPVMQTPIQQVIQTPQVEQVPVQSQIPVTAPQQSSASAMVAADPRLAGLL